MLMGDLGVSDKELGYMFGRYKRLTGNYHSMMSRYSAANEYRQKADGMGAVLFAKVRHLYIGHSSNPMILYSVKPQNNHTYYDNSTWPTDQDTARYTDI